MPRLDGGPEDGVGYFAYGANMHDGPFQEHRGMRPSAWPAGRIPGYRLRFNLDGRPKGRAGPANISPDKDGKVWGVFYKTSLGGACPTEYERWDPQPGLPTTLARHQ